MTRIASQRSSQLALLPRLSATIGRSFFAAITIVPQNYARDWSISNRLTLEKLNEPIVIETSL
jgi:hypothetical protein